MGFIMNPIPYSQTSAIKLMFFSRFLSFFINRF